MLILDWTELHQTDRPTERETAETTVSAVERIDAKQSILRHIWCLKVTAKTDRDSSDSRIIEL